MTGASAAPDEYVAFCEGVRRLANLDLLQYKRGQMERRIRAFADRRGMRRLADYLSLLQREDRELTTFLDRVTINVSQLWRNPEQWTLLARQVLPELAARARIRAWSAGCSYGAEVFTLAVVARESAPAAQLDVLGSDLDPRMIARAKEAVFSQEDARTAPEALLSRWFDPVDGGWRAKPELRRVARFEVADLLRAELPRGVYDLVLCRNVVIYFQDSVRDALHARLAETLRPGGYLMIGSTERISTPASLGLAPAFPFVYRRG